MPKPFTRYGATSIDPKSSSCVGFYELDENINSIERAAIAYAEMTEDMLGNVPKFVWIQHPEGTIFKCTMDLYVSRKEQV